MVMFLRYCQSQSAKAARSLLRRRSVTQARTWSTYTRDDTSLTIHSLNASFPYVWLRDSCQSSPDCIHPTTLQKLHRTSDIPIDIRPTKEGVKIADGGVYIHWTDGHESFFHSSFLERHSSRDNLFAFHQDVKQIPWDHASISNTPDLFVSYQSLQTPQGLLAAMTQISRYGLLFVSGVPSEETSDATCELPKLAQLFSEIRPTFYGMIWDVKNVINSRNIAYTNLDLGLHMDILYFEQPPRYQILHCLRNRVSGGSSIFVDTFQAAHTLRESNALDFDVLASTPVAFHYINDGHHLHREHYTIELDRTSQKQINSVNYSPPFQAPLPLSTPLAFYPALARFAKLLNDTKNTYTYTLKEGDAVLFDNRRVLHARTAFSDLAGDGNEEEANRWLKGCYLEADALLDRARVLRSKLHAHS